MSILHSVFEGQITKYCKLQLKCSAALKMLILHCVFEGQITKYCKLQPKMGDRQRQRSAVDGKAPLPTP